MPDFELYFSRNKAQNVLALMRLISTVSQNNQNTYLKNLSFLYIYAENKIYLSPTSSKFFWPISFNYLNYVQDKGTAPRQHYFAHWLHCPTSTRQQFQKMRDSFQYLDSERRKNAGDGHDGTKLLRRINNIRNSLRPQTIVF